ncbi:MAG: T9SS type A sorting domain-containing protein [Saprospiraceae bacterium]|nr:T9SS type A sorting domain-containing protein [Saprospiraceae bacterium]MCB9322847.1 T9SS type A sorting domain-containing protein [Lewinellaceae bacterium]
MKHLYLLFLALAFPFLAQAQINPNCDGERYLTDVFPDEPVMTTVKFGENTTISGVFQELFMDIFEPAGDEADNRPVLLFAFGGSFIGGERSQTHDICKAYAKKGYVTAAIDYRLYDFQFPPFGPFPDSLLMMEEVVMAVGDLKAAIRYFRKDAATTNTFRIDSDFIFTGGYSSGSIVSLHAAYLDDGEAPTYVQEFLDDNGGMEGDTDDPEDSNMGYSSSIQGVVNYFGALHRKEYMDAGDPPIISIHGDADPIVPYGHGFAVVVVIPIVAIDGSGELHPRAQALGIPNELITVPGGGHGDFSQEFNDSMLVRSTLFLGDILCNGVSGNQDLRVETQAKAFPNPASDYMQLVFEELPPSPYTIQVSNQLGQTVFSKFNQNTSEFVLDRSEFGSGVFVLSVVFEDKNIQPVVRKIIFK